MMQAIGQKVKTLREAKGLTQKELTARSGDLSPSYLANLENGEIKKPGGAKLTMIARGLDISPETLLQGTDAKALVAEESKTKARTWCLNRDCPKAIVDVAPTEMGVSHNGEPRTLLEKFDTDYIHQWRRDGLWHGLKSYASFPAFNTHGEAMNYCPACGSLLLENCPSCQRLIESSDQMYCTGCGTDLHQEWEMRDDIDRDMYPR